MKKNIRISLLLAIFSISLQAQINLVPNPSFEDTIQCPGIGEGYINYASGWKSYGSSPDYFNNCNHANWGVPNNVFGYQTASTGNAYAGFIAYDKSIPHTDKEFIGRQLSQSLIIGQKYFVSFKLNLPKKDTSNINNYDCAVFACNKLGVLFTNAVYDEFNPPVDNNFAHIWSDSIIIDTLNWVPISGTFIADSAYTKIVIGIFFNNTNVDTIRLFKPSCDVFAYYFIDDVCVSTDSLECNHPVSVIENKTDINSFIISPNPATDYFTINHNLTNESYNLTIYNTLGQMLYEEKNISKRNKTICTATFNKGLLLIKIKSINQTIIYKLLNFNL